MKTFTNYIGLEEKEKESATYYSKICLLNPSFQVIPRISIKLSYYNT